MSSDQALAERAELLAFRLDSTIAERLRGSTPITYDDLIAIILPVLKQTRDEVSK